MTSEATCSAECSSENDVELNSSLSKRRCLEEMFCQHCQRIVSKSTFYRHCLKKVLNTTPAAVPSSIKHYDSDIDTESEIPFTNGKFLTVNAFTAASLSLQCYAGASLN